MVKHSMGKHSLLALTLALLHVGVVHAAPITFTTTLTGAGENPPNASPGTGIATVVYDDDTHRLSIETAFSGLTAGTTAAHIHCCAPPPTNSIPATTVPSFLGFPTGVTEGSFEGTLDLTLGSSFNPAFLELHGASVSAAEAAFAAGLASGGAYLNIHTTAFPGGEIRGFLRPVPEPHALSAVGLALLMLIAARARH
ncbi:CHRD domain-containing protein [Aromatoleum sp.]|uniref:CHRD domain-containing protein n=1 Tax=Aromatoleum sp. TaxID=2307007 RepID=UPI002FC6DD20